MATEKPARNWPNGCAWWEQKANTKIRGVVKREVIGSAIAQLREGFKHWAIFSPKAMEKKKRGEATRRPKKWGGQV